MLGRTADDFSELESDEVDQVASEDDSVTLVDEAFASLHEVLDGLEGNDMKVIVDVGVLDEDRAELFALMMRQFETLFRNTEEVEEGADEEVDVRLSVIFIRIEEVSSKRFHRHGWEELQELADGSTSHGGGRGGRG